MGEVLDFSAYQARPKDSSKKQTDGLTVAAAPAFLVFRHYQAGVIRNEWRLLSERLLRGLLDQIHVDERYTFGWFIAV
jgi:hypothetical protein